MADTFVRNILQNLKVPEKVIEEFKNQEIDEEAFKSLTESMIQELVPLIGFRSKIFKKIQEIKKITSESSSNLDSTNSVLDNKNDFDIFSHQTLFGIQNVLDPVPVDHSSFKNELVISKETFTSIDSTNNYCIASTSFDNNIYSPKQNTSIIEKVVPPYDLIQANPSSSDTSILNASKHLKDILLSYHEGQIILESYEKNKELNNMMKNKLSHLIISHSFKNNAEKKISTEKFISFSQAIVHLFSCEVKETYYTPYKKESNRVIPARGKLWDKYCNMRKEVRHNAKKSDQLLIPEVIFLNNEEVTEDILWLKNNIAPWDLVVKKWNNTFKSRYNSLIGKEEKNSYLCDYPALKSPLGYTLIDLDFEQLYSGKELIFFTNFEILQNKLAAYARKCNIKGIDKLVDELLNPPELGNKTVTALKIFIELFKPINVSKRNNSGNAKKSYSRPSKLEIQQSFIYYVNNVSQLKEVDDEKTNKARRTGETVQPYMIFIETDAQVNSFYVIVNKYFYKVESALKAIDTCFKSFFVFHVNYPPECEQVWQFIQIFMYSIETKYDKNFQTVTNMIHDFNTC